MLICSTIVKILIRKQGLGIAGISSSSWDTCVRRLELTEILSQEEDELRKLLDLFESALLTFSLARFSMVPEKISTSNTRRNQGVKKRVSVSVIRSCGALNHHKCSMFSVPWFYLEGKYFCVFWFMNFTNYYSNFVFRRASTWVLLLVNSKELN